MNVFIFQVILFMIMDFIAASQDLRDSEPGGQKKTESAPLLSIHISPLAQGGIGAMAGA